MGEVGSPAAQSSSWTHLGERSAAVVFGLLTAGCAVYYLVLGRSLWFFSDEWDQLATRSATDIDDLLRPHNDHIQLIPTLIYRALFAMFGLESYLPYRIPVLTAFLASAVLLRVIARRAGCAPWPATLAAGAYLLLGSCIENIVLGIQISMMGSVATGLAAIVLLDRVPEQSSLRVDALAVALGVTSILCSGVGVAMVALGGLVVMIRRGPRAAVGTVAIPALLYLTWSYGYGTSDLRPGSVVNWLDFVRHGVQGTFLLIGQTTPAAIALAILLAAGTAMAVTDDRSLRPDGSRLDQLRASPLVVPLVLLVGAVAMIAYSGLGRAGPFGAESARSPRYVALSITLVVPALAVAADAVSRRSRVGAAVAAVVLVAGVPGNIAAGGDLVERRAGWATDTKELILALPTLPEGRTAPDDLRPLPETIHAPDLTMGHLRNAVDEGWLPRLDPDEIDPHVRSQAELRLSLYQHHGQRTAPSPEGCTVLGTPRAEGAALALEEGEDFSIAGGFVTVEALNGDGQPVHPDLRVTFNPNLGDVVRVVTRPLDVSLTSEGTNGPASLCDLP